MERHKLVESFNCAIEGIIYVLKTQRNMRVHFVAAIIIIIVAVALDLSRFEFLFIAFAIFFVLFAEMVNTAAELTIDLISDTYHPLARMVKDIGAGAVLLASVNAVIIGYLVCARRLEGRVLAGADALKGLTLHVTLLALLVVLVSAVAVKLLAGRGTPMRGGMPSVHSAVAFAAATIVTLLAPHLVSVIMLS
ncbi:MAG: diacylglycerol kinase [Candidatus Aureabacteria bacterium]|nr:diacylglycerol kinase [Candidatus Auribacterota bacterium]